MCKVIAVDVDGVLCEGEAWTERDCMEATPIRHNIQKVNELYNHNFIVIYSARRRHLLNATAVWLDDHNVRYHAICPHSKMAADAYIDDKNMEL